MQFFNSAGFLAILTLGSVVSSLPSSTLSSGLDANVTFDVRSINLVMEEKTLANTQLKEYIKQFKQPESLDKRWTGGCPETGLNMPQHIALAHAMCDSAIRSLENQDDTNRRRFDRYFGSWNNYPTARSIIATRYRYIKDTLNSPVFKLECHINETNGNVIADVSSSGQGNPATVRLFHLWFTLSDPPLCGDQFTKANTLLHEASHVFGSADHGNDQGNDAYLLQWYASCKSIPYNQANLRED